MFCTKDIEIKERKAYLQFPERKSYKENHILYLFLNMSGCMYDNIYKYTLCVVLFTILILLVSFLIFFITFNEPYQFTDEEIKKGRQEIQNSRVVFAGLIRDKEDRISYLQKRLEALSKPFRDYHILIVENDSKDKTRERLLEWHQKNPKVTILGCGENVPRCILGLESTKSRSHSSNRIKKMSQLRNIYVNYLRENFSDWDYLVVNDFDLLADLSDMGWKSAFGHFKQDQSLSAISAYGFYDLFFKKIFYDDFAFVPLNSPIEVDNVKESPFRLKEKIEMELYLLETKKELVEVKSAFSGLTIYRISHIPANARYDFCHSEDKKACEHSYFNQYLNKIVIHPGLKYRIIKNNL